MRDVDAATAAAALRRTRSRLVPAGVRLRRRLYWLTDPEFPRNAARWHATATREQATQVAAAAIRRRADARVRPRAEWREIPPRQEARCIGLPRRGSIATPPDRCRRWPPQQPTAPSGEDPRCGSAPPPGNPVRVEVLLLVQAGSSRPRWRARKATAATNLLVAGRPKLTWQTDSANPTSRPRTPDPRAGQGPGRSLSVRRRRPARRPRRRARWWVGCC